MSSKVPIAHNLSSKFRTEDVLLGDGNKTDFKSMILPPRIIDGLTKAGFVQPSPIQLKAIPLARCGFDLIVQSKSGTGKTCVFTVAALDSLNIESRRLQTLVLAPTREIANQIKFVIDAIGSQFPGLNVVPLIGGLPMQKDRERLIYGCHIVVGTPGRVRHCMELGLIELDAVRLFVLDEADMLMTPSFQADINEIYQQLPSSKQVLVCSATYTPDLISFLSNYMHNATYVTPSGGQCTVLLGLRHFVLVSPDESSNQLRKLASKENQLMSILKSVPFSQCLVFSNYQTRAESICEKLRRKGWRDCCEWIAGSQDQRKRNDVYEKVRDFKARILLTTDLTARGVDFEAVNLVINLDMPSDPHTYLHRMGRAGRFGGQGIVITLLTTDEIPKFRKLIGKIGSHANAHVIPDILLNKELWVAKLDALEIIEGDFESKEPDTVYSPMSETANEAKINPGSENDNVLEDDEDIKTTELLEFGLKLLRLRKAPEFCSFKKLEESRRNYVGDVSADKEVSKWRKVLEPPGSLDSDVAEYFLSTYSEKSADVTKICKFTSFVDAFKALPTKCDLNDRNFNIKQRESNIDDLNLDKLEISVGCSNKDVVSHSEGHKDDLFHRLDSPKSKFSSSRSSSSSSLHSSNSIENITDETSNLLLDARSIDHSGSRENKTKKPVHIFVPNRRSCEPSTSNTSDYRENRDSRYKNEFIGASSSSPPKRKLYKLNASSTSSENQQESYDNDESNVQSFHHYPQVGVRNTRTQRKRMRQTTSPPVQRNDPRMYSSYPNSNHHHSSHGPTSSIDQWNRLYHQQLSQIRMFTNYSYYLNYMLHFQDHHK